MGVARVRWPGRKLTPVIGSVNGRVNRLWRAWGSKLDHERHSWINHEGARVDGSRAIVHAYRGFAAELNQIQFKSHKHALVTYREAGLPAPIQTVRICGGRLSARRAAAGGRQV